MRETPEETMRILEQRGFFTDMRAASRDSQYNVCKRIVDMPWLAPCARLIVERLAEVTQDPSLLKLLKPETIL